MFNFVTSRRVNFFMQSKCASVVMLLTFLWFEIFGSTILLLPYTDYYSFSSGLTSSINRGVTPVYLHCVTGKVTWLYPSGALRVLLRLPDGKSDFRACIKVKGDNSARGVNKKTLPARLFLEGPRSLLNLYSDNDGGNKGSR